MPRIQVHRDLHEEGVAYEAIAVGRCASSYQGGLQLSPRTWSAHGGGEFAPQANEASREQQILVGERVRAEQGWEAWSGCAHEIAPS